MHFIHTSMSFKKWGILSLSSGFLSLSNLSYIYHFMWLCICLLEFLSTVYIHEPIETKRGLQIDWN